MSLTRHPTDSVDEKPLTGWTAFTLRPSGEARQLLLVLRSRGARAFNLPLLRLRALPARDIAPMLNEASNASTWIFSSPAAVRFLRKTAFDLSLSDDLFGKAGGLTSCARRGHVFAPGPGTASALGQVGVVPVQIPTCRFDSEGLLELPALAALQGHKVAVVGGEGGRGRIEQVLAQRGADITVLRLYRRAAAPIAPRQRERLLRDQQVLLIASSASTLIRLAECLSPEELCELTERSPIVLSSARLCEQAQALGFRRHALARSAMPEALAEAAVSVTKSFARDLDTRDSVSMTP